jgi:carbamoyltransferase
MAGDLFVLGINAYDHDVSACLLRNGEVCVAIAKERVTRIKHDSGFYDEAVNYCLEAAGIPLERVDLVVRNCYVLPTPEMERRLLATHDPYHLTVRERERARRHPLFGASGPRIAECSHHLAHAYSAFAPSPFREGAVMVVDGVGGYRADVLEPVPGPDDAHPLARESESYYVFEDASLRTVKKVFMGPSRGLLSDEFWTMPGLGALYSRAATYVFGHWDKCGELMGLAPYGRLSLPPLVELQGEALRFAEWPASLANPFVGVTDAAWEASAHRLEWEDLARRVQEDLERALLERARWLHRATGARNLAIAGGVALNCVAMGRIVEESPFENVFVQPAAGDDGIALGCALYGHIARLGGRRAFAMETAAFGRAYDEAEVRAAVSTAAARIGAHRRASRDVPGDAARALASGAIVGWFQGRSEFGPRALGRRSILADPRDPAAKDRLNRRVKHRQAFRPFAPCVPVERAAEFFEGRAESPFMLLAKRVRPEKRDLIPAVTHVDGTARVQTVRREENPRLHALLEAFGARTGVPVLVNTSFNVRGDPIVETPLDAIECFLYTGIDVLVLHNWIVRKRAVHRAFFPLFRFAINLRRGLRSEALMERAARSVLDVG